MPNYDYRCKSNGCEDSPTAEKYCSIADSVNAPTCEVCGDSMIKAFFKMPGVSWKYINPSGQVKTSSMGPDERAVKRCAGWDNGRKVLQPIYKSKRSEVKEMNRQNGN